MSGLPLLFAFFMKKDSGHKKSKKKGFMYKFVYKQDQDDIEEDEHK
jgi:hypothetical protein